MFIFTGINLVDEVPPKECTDRVVACDGGDPHLGHPKVYINLVRIVLSSTNWMDFCTSCENSNVLCYFLG